MAKTNLRRNNASLKVTTMLTRSAIIGPLLPRLVMILAPQMIFQSSPKQKFSAKRLVTGNYPRMRITQIQHLVEVELHQKGGRKPKGQGNRIAHGHIMSLCVIYTRNFLQSTVHLSLTSTTSSYQTILNFVE